jgi:ATP-dependent RNA helicase DeaD
MAGLLRDHLGARGGDPVAEASEARRARNPPPQPDLSAAAPATPRRGDGDHAMGRDGRADGLGARDNQREPRDGRRREARRDGRRDGGREVREGGSPVSSFSRWHPPNEADDDKPILRSAPDSSSRLPGVTISDPIREGLRDGDRASESPADEAFLQLFVNVGKRDGVRPADLQKLLSDRGVDIDASGGIRVRDRMSFVRVRKELFDDAVAALSGQVMGGRTVVAELARGGRT